MKKLKLNLLMAFPPNGNAILKSIKDNVPYVNGVKYPVDGIRVSVVRYDDLDPLDVIIKGIQAPISDEDIMARNSEGNFIVVSFTEFVGYGEPNYKNPNEMRMSGTAKSMIFKEKEAK